MLKFLFLPLVLKHYTVHYSGIGNTGVQDNVAYMSAKLKLWSMDFNLLDMMQVPLCDETMTADESNENECPGDGSHNYALDYKLPSAGNGATSWVASGWEGSGLVQMFAEPNEDMLIGECTLILRTYVTKSNTDTLELTPSASQTAGIVLAVAAMLALLIFWCYCCRRKKQNKIAVKDVESDETSFKRMEDERSFWSGLGSRASKKSATSKKTEANSEALSIVSELQ